MRVALVACQLKIDRNHVSARLDPYNGAHQIRWGETLYASADGRSFRIDLRRRFRLRRAIANAGRCSGIHRHDRLRRLIGCADPHDPLLRLSRQKGSVSELEWQIFLRDEVTKRFPDGLTVWEAEGQWLSPAGSIDREQSGAAVGSRRYSGGTTVGAGCHPVAPQGVRSAIGSVGKRASLRRGVSGA